jgi:gamma-glutamylcyclotransferase (GGCT)/AIG2-like uncharacterized protein YtfP
MLSSEAAPSRTGTGKHRDCGEAGQGKIRLGWGGRGWHDGRMEKDSSLAVFVYGSLVPGGSNWARFCEGRVADSKPVRVRGRVYQLRDGYLALAMEGEDLRWIRGWRLVLRNAAVLQNFDRLEGFEAARPSEQNDYQRVRAACFTDDDSAAPAALGEAWVYVMTPAQLARAGAVEIFSIPPT